MKSTLCRKRAPSNLKKKGVEAFNQSITKEWWAKEMKKLENESTYVGPFII